jgi:hypothetical protein
MRCKCRDVSVRPSVRLAMHARAVVCTCSRHMHPSRCRGNSSCSGNLGCSIFSHKNTQYTSGNTDHYGQPRACDCLRSSAESWNHRLAFFWPPVRESPASRSKSTTQTVCLSLFGRSVDSLSVFVRFSWAVRLATRPKVSSPARWDANGRRRLRAP